MMWSSILLSLIVVVAVSGQQRICMQLENIDNAETTRAQLRDPAGKKGQKGEVGPPRRVTKGDTGEVDYVSIYSKINETLTAFRAEMEERMATFQEEIKTRFVSTRSTASSTTSSPVLSKYCQMIYNGRCFWTEIHPSQDVDIASSRRICQRNRGSPANIYSEEHLTMTLSHMRQYQYIPSGQRSLYLWSGMQVRTQTGSVTLFNGSPAPYVKWRSSGYPDDNEDYVYVVADSNPSASDQGYGNDPQSSKYWGTICEA